MNSSNETDVEIGENTRMSKSQDFKKKIVHSMYTSSPPIGLR